MALIICKECQKEVSDQAKICPNCGFDFATNRVKNIASKGCFIYVMFIAVCLFIIAVLLM